MLLPLQAIEDIEHEMGGDRHYKTAKERNLTP